MVRGEGRRRRWGRWAATDLQHEPLDDAVEQEAVVVAVLAVPREVLHRLQGGRDSDSDNDRGAGGGLQLRARNRTTDSPS